ncbi:hypothetical protein EZV62_019366 [Acer yangbiense]|uniref:Retrovirus-related Pol polyprotein from transposon TNT 1-94-like beta-barrel domain-containing protein n=1 Tax=Acer yangbiense TaxID=1000413 RepID=A0A5C7HAQ6_9ROSI|nr:hypothetical protein EZV62_019366 [Acer yangbiense]
MWGYVSGSLGESEDKKAENYADLLDLAKYKIANEVWDHLARLYTQSNFTKQYQLESDIRALEQKTRREEQRLVQFLMALRDDFEGLCGSILHRSPLPYFDLVVSELLAEEIRLKSQARKGILPAPNPYVLAVLSRPPSNFENRPYSKVGIDECSFCMSSSIRVLDSGASHHMSLDSSSFVSLCSATSVSIMISYGSPMPLAGVGSSVTPNVTLSNVYHIPNLTLNLVSVSQLCESGYGEGQKGYHCFDPVTYKLYVSRHVIFLVHIPFFSIPTSTRDMTKSDLICIDPFSDDTNSLSSPVPCTTDTDPHSVSSPFVPITPFPLHYSRRSRTVTSADTGTPLSDPPTTQAPSEIVDPHPRYPQRTPASNMDTKRLVIYHGGSWVGNSYEGGLTKWVHVPRGLTYDALVKLVQDVAKVDTARYTIELCSLVSTNIGVARPIIENDNEVLCMMDEDKFIPAVYVTICQKGPTDCVQNSTTVDKDDNLLQSNFFQQSYQPTPQAGYDGFVLGMTGLFSN